MYDSPSYPAPSGEEIRVFLAQQPCGILIAQRADGFPSATLLPFVYLGDAIEVHMVQDDATCAALRHSAQAAFLVEEFLAFTPHTVVHGDDAGLATLHFRAVQFDVRAALSTARNDVAAALERLLARYEPAEAHRRVEDGDYYGERLARLAVARLEVIAVHAKFKIAQRYPQSVRQDIARFLEQRGQWRDLHAASVIRGRD